MKTMKISLITMLLFFLTSGALTMANTMTSQAGKLPGISIQLWSVKEDVKDDIDATLESLAKLGFSGVEFAGEFGRYQDNPEALKAKLDVLGLKASGAHVSFAQLNQQNLEQTVAFYQALEVPYLIIGWDERAWDEEKIDEVVALLNQASKNLKAHGMQVGFHNHDHEFDQYLDATFWDYIAGNTHDSVVMQQDVGWTTYAGKDPVAYVKRYPGRTQTTHYKVVAKDKYPDLKPVIGQGAANWPALLHANIEQGGTQWLVVEQEEDVDGYTRMQSLQQSLQALQQLLKPYRNDS